jgi:hypothetical protein
MAVSNEMLELNILCEDITMHTNYTASSLMHCEEYTLPRYASLMQ